MLLLLLMMGAGLGGEEKTVFFPGEILKTYNKLVREQ